MSIVSLTDGSKKVRLIRRAGVLAPLFSVYSKDSLGIGDLDDLRLLIDWASKTGNSIVQLLPMNEVGPLFCPYDSVSSFALEPAYISLSRINGAKERPIAGKIDKIRKKFPAGKKHVDYRVKNEKLELLWEIYNLGKEAKAKEFKKFKEENIYWLPDFSLYKSLKDYHRGLAWYDWQPQFRNRERRSLNSFQGQHEEEINFQMWVQWQLYKQFKDVKSYAESKNIFLKGDLPILVSRDSACVWTHSDFFKLAFAAGAPADIYAALGQRWGMPTYNWEKIKEDNFTYFKEKLKFAENFYDILRIDHVVGLFRIWSIPYNEPLENKGLHGFFDPGDQSKWRGQGKEILSVMLESTKMLLCAEDLGVIPKECTETLQELMIPGNDVERWMKDWKIRHDFLEPSEYRELSVAMLSTHDTTNWPAWWEDEAGTIDEDLFIRKCSDHRQINFKEAKDKLFNAAFSKYTRLRWLDTVDEIEKLVWILGRKREELGDFVELYENSFREKEKLWKYLGLGNKMQEKSDSKIVHAILKKCLDAKAIFCINTLIDYLYLNQIFKGDPFLNRINTPGTISEKNWSLTIPISLEELLKSKVNKDIRKLIIDSKRR